MIDTVDDSRTPWQPAGLRLPRVGDRVVFRRGECDRHQDAVQDGDTGVVVDGSDITVVAPPAAGHTLLVVLDVKRRLGPGRQQWGAVCAAIELEILADDDGG